ncbi:MAG: NADP-dependent oxidoreductase [Betaproteobacteria bacterium]
MMSSIPNRRWLISQNPLGRSLKPSDFRLDEQPCEAPDAGDVVVKVSILGIDPSQKGAMENVASYAAATRVGQVMPGKGVGTVIESRSRNFSIGDVVMGAVGWQEYATLKASLLEMVPEGVPHSYSLSVLGSTGLTAYFGLFDIGRPVPGDVLVVSGAGGAVGSIVGQLGRLAGCHTIGIAGSASKCEALLDRFGFNAAINYKEDNVRRVLRELAPEGIDIYFDNVGGSLLDDCLSRLAFGARIVVCGGISRYNADPRDKSQLPPGPQNYFSVVHTKSRVEGFLLPNYESHFTQAKSRLKAWVERGALVQQEDVLEGIERAPEALIRLFEGSNQGKQLVLLDRVNS